MERELTAAEWADAELIWHYHHLGHDLLPCSAALVLGGNDILVASYAAELYHRGLFPMMVITGATSPATEHLYPRGEAVHFMEIALQLDVPAEAILVEPNARNTGQNFTFSRQVFEHAGITPTSLLLIAMPYMERRAYATCLKQWPEVEPRCSSAPVTLREYVTMMGSAVEVVEMMVGDLQRIIEYPQLGFAIGQNVPQVVLAAFNRLLARGFTRLLR
ncbi:YdcF family protein [Amycolatopsis sp. PS_44_ISF1]|uniref:YdcF family protein n=1 Tax=Amycolatopsis sp. PS_44_ISF1 TaxID=2974917 RepID=UPI0028DEC4F8|nr:YdcF family protein [Amycolatopsis sp. PS_44_ISF1]MDT8916020.1 YdcF family protein [Amycolatopsis sp. PS_44_ISF1]